MVQTATLVVSLPAAPHFEQLLEQKHLTAEDILALSSKEFLTHVLSQSLTPQVVAGILLGSHSLLCNQHESCWQVLQCFVAFQSNMYMLQHIVFQTLSSLFSDRNFKLPIIAMY